MEVKLAGVCWLSELQLPKAIKLLQNLIFMCMGNHFLMSYHWYYFDVIGRSDLFKFDKRCSNGS